MKGAIIGDIVGSVYEFNNIKTKDFPLFSDNCFFTDDTVMTIAVANGLINASERMWDLLELLSEEMRDYGNRYPHCGYGGRFRRWLSTPDAPAYNSWGNGAPMRCSAAGWFASSPEKAFQLGMYTAGPTHNHPESMKAAGLTATLIWHARNGKSKEELRQIAEKWYYLPVLDEIREKYRFDVSCMGTMPVALSAFFESIDFEDAIRNAISIGGDSDTISAITGAIAEAFYGVPDDLWQKARGFLTEELAREVETIYEYVLIDSHPLDDSYFSREELSLLSLKDRARLLRKLRKGIRVRSLRDFLEEKDDSRG